MNYADFCANIDHVFSDAANASDFIENSKSTAKFTEEEKEQLIHLLNAMREEIKHNRILIKPQFQDFDTTKSCHITAEQFRRVLKECSILPPSEALFQVLVRKYFDKGNMREVNYVNFCQDIDRPADLFKPYVAKKEVKEKTYMPGERRDAGNTFFKDSTLGLDVISNRFMQQRIETSNDPSDVENRLQAAVVMKRVRIEEFFQDFDKLRKGRVTKRQFESIMSMLNFYLTKEELNFLSDRYKVDGPE